MVTEAEDKEAQDPSGEYIITFTGWEDYRARWKS